MKVRISLSGGLELIFNKEKNFTIELEKKSDEDELTIQDVISILIGKITERPEFFVTSDNIV